MLIKIDRNDLKPSHQRKLFMLRVRAEWKLFGLTHLYAEEVIKYDSSLKKKDIEKAWRIRKCSKKVVSAFEMALNNLTN